MIRRLLSVAALSLAFATPALAQSPLVLESRSTYLRAAKNMLGEIGKGRGMADLRNSVNQCYGIVGHDLKKAQYCYALHYSAMIYDAEMLRGLGVTGQTPGFDKVDVIARMAMVCKRMIIEPEQCGIMLRDWRIAWGG